MALQVIQIYVTQLSQMDIKLIIWMAYIVMIYIQLFAVSHNEKVLIGRQFSFQNSILNNCNNSVERFIQIAHFGVNMCHLAQVLKSCTFDVWFNCRKIRRLSMCSLFNHCFWIAIFVMTIRNNK